MLSSCSGTHMLFWTKRSRRRPERYWTPFIFTASSELNTRPVKMRAITPFETNQTSIRGQWSPWRDAQLTDGWMDGWDEMRWVRLLLKHRSSPGSSAVGFVASSQTSGSYIVGPGGPAHLGSPHTRVCARWNPLVSVHYPLWMNPLVFV